LSVMSSMVISIDKVDKIELSYDKAVYRVFRKVFVK